MRTAALLYVASTLYATKVDGQGFYSTREYQIFKSEDVRKLDIGNIPGDEIPYLTWSGFISGKDVYFEVHGAQVRLRAGSKKTTLSFHKAPALPTADRDNIELDPHLSTLYVKSAKNPTQSLICIESLGPDTYTRPRPYWEVYLLIDPIGNARLYRASGINASCKGVERLANGKLIVPAWHIDKKKSPSVVINYYTIQHQTYQPTNLRFTGEVASEDAHEYIITE